MAGSDCVMLSWLVAGCILWSPLAVALNEGMQTKATRLSLFGNQPDND